MGRLRGLAKFHKSDGAFGLSSHDLNNILDGIDCLSLLAHTILRHVGAELREFAAFSAWLRYEIDVQAADSTLSTDDPAEKERLVDFAKVLDYIQGPMLSSKVADLISMSASRWSATSSDSAPLYARLTEDLRLMKSETPPNRDLLSLGDVYAYLEHHCGLVFQRIAESQKRNVLFGAPLRLTSEDIGSVAEMRMLYEASGSKITLLSGISRTD